MIVATREGRQDYLPLSKAEPAILFLGDHRADTPKDSPIFEFNRLVQMFP